MLNGAELNCLYCDKLIPMRDRGRVDLFVLEPVPHTTWYKIRRLRGVSPIFDRRPERIVGAEGCELYSRHIVGGVHKRCSSACNGLSNANVKPHEGMGLDDVRNCTRTTIERYVRQEVAVA